MATLEGTYSLIGTFATEEEARVAYMAAKRAYHPHPVPETFTTEALNLAHPN